MQCVAASALAFELTWTSSSPTVIVLIVVGLGLIVSYVLSARNRRRPPQSTSPGVAFDEEVDDQLGVQRARPGATGVPGVTPREQLERMKQERGMRRDLGELAGEVEALAQRLGAQLDAQARRVEDLIRQADQRIARLEALQKVSGCISGDAKSNPTPFSEPGSPTGPVLTDSPTLRSTLPPATQATRPAPAAQSDDPMARRIYQLADAGLDSQSIARKLGEHVGKVELILALRSA
jgi:hypothetical protein